MSLIILLDSGPAGLVTNPRATPQNEQVRQWMRSLLARGVLMLMPEIVDYELQRELLRGNKVRGIRRLDQFKATGAYVPLSTVALLQAAQFWAQARQQGQPTASNESLDLILMLFSRHRHAVSKHQLIRSLLQQRTSAI